MSNYTIHILHLFPDLLNLYGDKGNIASLEKRLAWRGIDATVTVCTQENSAFTPSDADIIFLGGGSDREQEVVAKLLQDQKDELKAYAEQGGVLLGFCGGFELLGNYFHAGDSKIEGLGILDIHADAGEHRLISDVILQSDLVNQPICGFENHAGRMDIGSYTPLGKVTLGSGNNGVSGYEGVVYKNVFGTFLHGPLLPKNPKLCDEILTRALKHKYPDFDALAPLNDEIETLANNYIVTNFTAK